MKIYNVEVIENLSRVVSQKANSYEEAEEIVSSKYDNEEIVLDWNDLNSTNYKPYPPQIIKKSFNIEIDFDKKEGNVIIADECSSGVDYDCKSIEDLKIAINSYLDNYIELEKVVPEKTIKKKDLER